MIKKTGLYLILILLSGCELATLKTVKDPQASITLRETPVTKELSCFSDMVATYQKMRGKPPISAMLVSVEDSSGVSKKLNGDGEIPYDMTDMAIGSLAKIGGNYLSLFHIPRNDNVYEPYPAPEARAKLPIVKPYEEGNILIYGSLTEYDRSLQNNKAGIDANADYATSKTREK